MIASSFSILALIIDLLFGIVAALNRGNCIPTLIITVTMGIRSDFDSGIIFITHDMGVIRQMADQVMVMYAGQVMEYVQVDELFAHPLHPYTQGLIHCIRSLENSDGSLYVIDGNVPMLNALPQGCLFAPRCPYATDRCRTERPGLYGNEAHRVRCFRCEASKEGKA